MGPATPTGWSIIQPSGQVRVYNPYELNGGGIYYAGATPASDPANAGSGYAGIVGEQLGYAWETPSGSGFSQVLSATLDAAATYTLTVNEGRRNGTDGTAGAPNLGSELLLLAGSTVIASAIDSTGTSVSLGQFVTQTAYLADSDQYSSLVGQSLKIEILTTVSYTGTYVHQATDWDNVTLTEDTATPEPGTLLLGGLALAGLFILRSYR